MAKPTSHQTINLAQFSKPRPAIIARQTRAPSGATIHTAGVLNGAFAIFLFRIIKMPMHTNTKANKVPILVISPTTLSGINAANKETKTKNTHCDLYGVRCLGCTSENTEGTSPSLDMV